MIKAITCWPSKHSVIFWMNTPMNPVTPNQDLARKIARSVWRPKEAFEVLNALDPAKLPWKLQPFYYAVYADALIHQKKYKEAIPSWSWRLIKSTEKKESTLHFYHCPALWDNRAIATGIRMYSKVIKMNPLYEIAFNALINRAAVFEEGQDDRLIRQQLIKMLSDTKNKDYRDQIYTRWAISIWNWIKRMMPLSIIRCLHSSAFQPETKKQNLFWPLPIFIITTKITWVPQNIMIPPLRWWTRRIPI